MALETDGLGGFASWLRRRDTHSVGITACYCSPRRRRRPDASSWSMVSMRGSRPAAGRFRSLALSGMRRASWVAMVRRISKVLRRPHGRRGCSTSLMGTRSSRRFSSFHDAPLRPASRGNCPGRRRSEAHRTAVSLGPRLPRAPSEQPFPHSVLRRAVRAGCVTWQPYGDVPSVTALSNGHYVHEPHWCTIFYTICRAGAGPGLRRPALALVLFMVQFGQRQRPALIFTTSEYANGLTFAIRGGSSHWRVHAWAANMIARRNSPNRLHASADAYIVQRSSKTGAPGKTVIAGHPWFTDWGRDDHQGRAAGCAMPRGGSDGSDAHILIPWASTVSEGMLPNRFPITVSSLNRLGGCALWFVNAVREYLDARIRVKTARYRGQ